MAATSFLLLNDADERNGIRLHRSNLLAHEYRLLMVLVAEH